MAQSKEVVEPTNKAQEFIEKYNKLVQESGYQIMTVPAWKLRDDNTWSMVLQVQVSKLPIEEEDDRGVERN